MNEHDLAAQALLRAWKMGMHHAVLIYLRRQDPIVAAYLALQILGLLSMEGGTGAGLPFIQAVHDAAAPIEEANGS